MSQCPILAPGVGRPEGRADLGDLLRRPPQGRRSRSSPRRATGSTARSWAPRCRSEKTAAAAGRPRPGPPRPDGDAAVHRLQRRRLLPALDRRRQGRRRGQAAADLLRQLVPPRRRRPVPVAGLRREQPRAQVGHRAHRGQGRRGGDADRLRAHRGRPRPRRAGRRPRRRRGSSRGRPRGVARRDPAHRGVVPPDRVVRCRRPCATSSTPSSTVSGCSSHPGRPGGTSQRREVSPFGLEPRKMSVSGPTIPRDEVVEPGEGPVSKPSYCA